MLIYDIYRYVYYLLLIITIIFANSIIDKKYLISRIIRIIAFLSPGVLLLIPEFYVDAVLAYLLLLTIIGSITITLHSEGYLKILFGKISSLHLIIDLSLTLFIIFITSQRLIEFVITWIIVELTSTLLIMLERGYRNFSTVTKYLIVCVTAGDVSLFTLLAITSMYLGFEKITTLYIHELSQITNPLNPFITFLLIFGFTAKIAQIPLHIWLIDTYVTTPSPGTAIFSGLLSKMAIFALVRIHQFLNVDQNIYITMLLTQGILTTIYGFFSTALHSDIKKIMSYSSMGYYGIFTILLALIPYNSDLIMKILLIYIIYHGLIKIQLFLNIGSIELLTNTRDIYKLGYLAQLSPKIYSYSMLAFLSLIGIPPTIGFLAKFTLFTTIIVLIDIIPIISILLLITLGLASVFTVIYAVKYISIYTSMFRSKPMKGLIELPNVQYYSELIISLLTIVLTPLFIFITIDLFTSLLSIVVYLIGLIALSSSMYLRSKFVKRETTIWLGGVEI